VATHYPAEARCALEYGIGVIALQVQDFNISIRLVRKTRWGLYKVLCTLSSAVCPLLMLQQVVGECKSFPAKTGDSHQPLTANNVLMQPACKVCIDRESSATTMFYNYDCSHDD